RTGGVVARGLKHAHAVVGVEAVGGGVVDVPTAVDAVQLGGPDLARVPGEGARRPNDVALALVQKRRRFPDLDVAVGGLAVVVRAFVADDPGVCAAVERVGESPGG